MIIRGMDLITPHSLMMSELELGHFDLLTFNNQHGTVF